MSTEVAAATTNIENSAKGFVNQKKLPSDLQNYGSGIDIKQFNIPSHLKPIVLMADMSREDKTFESYGWTKSPFVHYLDSDTITDTGLFAVFKNDNFNKHAQKTQAAQQLEWQAKHEAERRYELYLPKHVPLIPNNYVQELVENAGYRVQKSFPSHHGYGQYWTLISDFKAEIKNSHSVNDEVALGCVVRNSMNGGVALGADLFTYRLSCLNGSVARGKDLGSVLVRHVGDPQRMLKVFKMGIDNIVEASKKLIAYYQEAAQIKVTQKMMEYIVKKTRLPAKYLPRYVDIEKKEVFNDKTKTKSRIISEVRMSGDHVNNVSLWETYNDLTNKMWHNMNEGTAKKSDQIGFFVTSEREKKLNAALMSIVTNNTNVKDIRQQK